MPAGYETTRIVLLEVQPFWVHAFWDVSAVDLAAARRELGEPGETILRIHDVTLVRFDGSNANGRFDVGVGEARSWYLDFWSSGKSIVADLGLVARDGRFVALARSEAVQLGRAAASAEGGPIEWMRVDGDPRAARRVACEVDLEAPVARQPIGPADPDHAMRSICREDVVRFYRRLEAGIVE